MEMNLPLLSIDTLSFFLLRKCYSIPFVSINVGFLLIGVLFNHFWGTRVLVLPTNQLRYSFNCNDWN